MSAELGVGLIDVVSLIATGVIWLGMPWAWLVTAVRTLDTTNGLRAMLIAKGVISLAIWACLGWGAVLIFFGATMGSAHSDRSQWDYTDVISHFVHLVPVPIVLFAIGYAAARFIWMGKSTR